MKLSNVLVDENNQVIDGSKLTEAQLESGQYRQFDEVLEDVLRMGVPKDELMKFIQHPFTHSVVFKQAQ